MGRSKFVYFGETIFDLTADTVTPDRLLEGTTAHDKAGEPITGTCTFDSDTSDATAGAAEILLGRTAYVSGAKVTGIMPNNGGITGVIEEAAVQYVVPQGYHDGSGKVSIAADEQAKLIPANIKSGVEILGVTGSYGGEVVTAQAKTAVPSITAQTILPDEGYDYLSQVTVAAIPYTETDNAAGGVTITIGG